MKTIKTEELIGNYEFPINSYSFNGNLKELKGITIITVSGTQTYFAIFHNGGLMRQLMNLEKAVEYYNNLSI